jgi:Family of unknown function (DUF6502)
VSNQFKARRRNKTPSKRIVTVQNRRVANPPATGQAAGQLFGLIATILLRVGVDLPNAQRLLRKAFVLAAREKARALDTRATQSQIASIAGMSRLEVRTILAEKHRETTARQSTRLDQLVAAWRTDPQFLDTRGRPKALELKGVRGSFEHLVKKYGRDVTSRTLRDELLSRGMASLRGRKLILKGSINRLHSDIVTADSDLRLLTSQLDGIDLQSGRRTYTTKRIAVVARDRKSVQMLKSIALGRIETVLSSLSGLSMKAPRGNAGSKPRGMRLIVNVSVASETEE